MSTQILLDVLNILGVIVLVLLNAFFVCAEFALVSVRRTRIAELVAKGNRSAKWVAKAIENPDRVIAATQLGITLASLGLGWIGEPALADLLHPIVQLLPEAIRTQASHGLAAALSFALITFLHVVVGELAPKSIALQNPERAALFVARPTLLTELVFKPAIWLLNGAGNGLLRLLGVNPASGHELVHSVEELKMLVRASAESGVVNDSEEVMLHAVFDFANTFVRHVMVPRTEIAAVPADSRLRRLIETFVRQPHTKLPVYEGNLDRIIGVLHIQDVLLSLYSEPRKQTTARQLMREAIFVPESASISTLLELFRDRHQHIAIALDEYGGTAGVVTLEDLLEEIVGEISSPFDTEPDEIQPLKDGSTLIDGLTLIQEVNEHFNLSLSDPNYDTLAGFILGRLGRMAKVGDCIIVEGNRLRVEEMNGLRISKVSLTPLSDKDTSAADAQPCA
jgi:CBS domain containing-hemolysin-like protein